MSLHDRYVDIYINTNISTDINIYINIDINTDINMYINTDINTDIKGTQSRSENFSYIEDLALLITNT